MATLRIRGKKKLEGRIRASGSKNASLPIIAASLLVPGKVTLRRVPDLADVHIIRRVIEALGAETSYDGKEGVLEIDSSNIRNFEAPYELVDKMRASFLVLGPLLSRFGEARVPLPGGCRIGTRSVAPLLNAIAGFGVGVRQEAGMVVVEGMPRAGEVQLEMPSVGATEIALMTASLAPGETRIANCAMEPEIVDLAGFLTSCGVGIEGAGTREITVQGVSQLSPADYTVIPDRLVAGTYLIAAASAGGTVTVEGCLPEHLVALTDKLIEIGCTLTFTEESITIEAPERLAPTRVRTQVYPGYPTDLQPQIVSALALADGVSYVTETLYENRFTHIPELCRMGARITTKGDTAVIEPAGNGLTGVPVKAYDIRGGAAMVIAGLSASGETTISGVGFIDRGHENLCEQLSSLGADIARIETNESHKREA